MSFFSRNIAFKKPLPLSLWRAVSVSSWRVTHDSSIVAILDLDAEPALDALAKMQSGAQTRLTLTHYAGWVMAKVLELHPELNCMVRWGRIYPRENCDVCFLVASGNPHKGSEDLSGVTISQLNLKSVPQLAEELKQQVLEMKKGGTDVAFHGIKSLVGHLPDFLRRPLVNVTDFILHSLNLHSPILGIKQNAFGSVMLTSVGSLGIDFAIARIYPQSRNSLMMSVGAVREEPVVRDGQIVIGKKMKVVFTVDHRIVDGMHGAYMLASFAKLFEARTV